MATDGEDGVIALSGFEERGGTVKVGRTDYAVGLIWRNIDDTNHKKIAAQAKEAAAERRADLYGVRDAAQYCLGSTKHGHKSGMPSLAATLASSLQGSFVGAFEVDGGIYMVAVPQDGVLATYDVIYSDPERANVEFQDLVHGGGWDQKFCPADWNVPDTKETSLEIMLSGASKSAKLKPVSPKGTIIKMALLAAVAVGSLLAYGQYEQWEADRVAAEEAETARLAEIERQRQLTVARDNIPDFPWKDRAIGQYALDACVSAILAAPTNVPGWTPVSLSCEGNEGNVVMTLRREAGGTINWVPFALNREGFRPSVRQATGSNIEVTWPAAGFGSIAKLTNTSETGQAAAALRYMLTHFEELYVPLPNPRVAQGATVQIPDPQNPNRTVPVVMSQSLEFDFTTRHDPREFLPILAPLKAATLTRVTLTIGDWTWKVEGQIHERLYNGPAAPGRSGAAQGRPGAPAR